MLTKKDFLSAAATLLTAVTLWLPPVPAVAATPPKPNIVVILVDDMGFSDIGCYGSEIPTPNLDKLAANGLRFTQFYNTGRCCPTRASILTGLYPHQAGVGHMGEDSGVPGYRGRLNDRCVTIAEVLRGAGYFTAMSGKWHVGQSYGVVPWERGFDRSLNSPAGGYYYPERKQGRIFLNGQALADDAPELPKNWYSTDLWTDFGIKFIDDARAAQKPFFLYLAYNAPHFPLQAPPDEIAKFRGKYMIGWDKLREQRHARQKELGVVDKAWALSPRPDQVETWDKLSDADKDRFDQIMAIYAACVAHIDTAVGRLVAALKQRGVLDNTLILFLSDNGGNAESGPKGRLEGDNPGAAGSTVFCGQSWATLENTPFRRYKHFNHEGGIATPLVVHWPAGFAAKGELRKQPGHLVDIMTTCVEVGGAKYPAEFQGRPILPMEGRSLVPAFRDKPIQRDALFWEHEGNAAVRVGDWKLVRLGRTGAWELYDLKADRTELHDLAAAQPKRAEQLAAAWEAWAERTNVKPYPAPAADAGKQGKKKGKGNAAKPNILFILSDDMGYGDIGCYGGKFAPTPNLDRLAGEGIRFTQYYSVSPICSPSRAGVTTGMYPARWNITSFLQTRAGNRGCEQADFLNPAAPSLARTLKAAGYATGHFGKWHMGGGRDVTNAPPFAAYGFDEHAGTWESPEPHPDITATNWIWSPNDKVKRWDRTAFFVDKTLDFLRRHKGQPCYVNIWPDDVHTPWVPSQERLGLYPSGPAEERKFRAVLDEYDRQMGRLLAGLMELGLEGSTIVIFSSDNGPLPSFRGSRSGGLRGSKLSLYEGGVRMPFMVRWPGHTPAGRVDDQTVLAATDLFPSLCRMAGVELPKDVAFDGEDLSGALLGSPRLRARPLFWEYGRNTNAFSYPNGADRSPNVSMREGDWKFLINADGTDAQLYDLKRDPKEVTNLAAKEPEVAARLQAQALAWRKALPKLKLSAPE